LILSKRFKLYSKIIQDKVIVDFTRKEVGGSTIITSQISGELACPRFQIDALGRINQLRLNASLQGMVRTDFDFIPNGK
jgi:hypothetical protein